MRDDKWLEFELDYLLKTYFSNVALINPIEIKFGREAKFRFGSIRLVSDHRVRGNKRVKGLRSIIRVGDKPKKSIIIITSMFAAENIPVDVVRYTIAHELCHYAHGFSSTNKRLFKHPHHGGIVNKELKVRGAAELIGAFKKWLKEYRAKILAGRMRI